MGRQRVEPGPGQESVWDYPRPPRLEDSNKRIKVVFGGVTLARTHRAKRVLETSHPPVYYIPPEDIKMDYLVTTPQGSFCEWKGGAIYHTVVVGDKQATNAAWSYPSPTSAFATIKDYLAFYAHLMDACYVNGEQVQPQPGNFYGGGGILKNLRGFIKGRGGGGGG